MPNLDQDAIATWTVIALIVAFILYVTLRMLILELASHPNVKAIAGVARKFQGGGEGLPWYAQLAAPMLQRWAQGSGQPGATVLFDAGKQPKPPQRQMIAHQPPGGGSE